MDAEVGDLAAPASASAPAPAPATPNVTVEPIGKGVWLLAGQSHHSVLVEFSDHLMLIEAPQSEARTLAVIAKAKQTVPGKPLQQLVTTHHHFDHTAGLRAAIAEGMTVITQSGNRAWVEAMARRPHTLQPDTLAKTAQRLVVETVDAEREYKDHTMTVMLYHVEGNPHSDTMLMAYIPSARVIVEVDAFSPGSAVNPYAANLLENIQKRKLRVDRIVPLHGAIAPDVGVGEGGQVMKTSSCDRNRRRGVRYRDRAIARLGSLAQHSKHRSRSSRSADRRARTSSGCRPRRPSSI